MSKKTLLRNSLVSLCIFVVVGAISEINAPWAKMALDQISHILSFEPDYRESIRGIQNYLAAELDSLWPDLADAGIMPGGNSAANPPQNEAPGDLAGKAIEKASPVPEKPPGAIDRSHSLPDRGGPVADRPTEAMSQAQSAEAPQLQAAASSPESEHAIQEEHEGPKQSQIRVTPPKTPEAGDKARERGAEFIAPVQGEITDGYGWRIHPVYRKRLFHEGIDVAVKPGTPVVAASAGRVTRAGLAGSYGLLVEIQHDDGIATLYAHCSRLMVRRGARVFAGQKIAEVGSSGLSTGPHLHFEVRRNGKAVNPLEFIERASFERR